MSLLAGELTILGVMFFDVRESSKMSGGLPREKRTVRGVGGEICLSGTEDPIYRLSIFTFLFDMFYHSCT